MKRLKCIRQPMLIVVLLSCFGIINAQQTEIYTNSERYLEEGISLYYQQHYAASQNMLMKYAASPTAQNIEQANFFLASNSFELRQTDAKQLLENYLLLYPYSTYTSEVHFMLGILLMEKGKFKQANKHFDKVDIDALSRDHQPELLFYQGYAYLEQQDLQKASQLFYRLRMQESLYNLQAQYYYSVCQYTLGNYGKALPGFLAIEDSELYKDIVPYYIVQIYYQQKQYDEVYARAERLLAVDKDSENSGELHRMLGEIYYQQGKYEQAQQHLLAYEESFTKQNKQLLREDIYLLGMTYYQLHNYQMAVVWFNKVKKLDDELSQSTCMNTGHAYTKLGHTELAKMSYSAAMRYDFDPVMKEEAMYNYAITTYQSSSALGESITAFTDFLKAYPESKHKEQVWTLLADVFLSSKNYQAGYDAICQIENPTPQLQQTKQILRYQLGVETFEQGKMEEAIDHFTAVINEQNAAGNQLSAEGKKLKAESYYWRAEAYYRLRDYTSSQKNLEAFFKEPNVSGSDNYLAAKYLLGYIHFSKQEYQDASRVFSDYIIKAEPTSATYADALNRIGDCYFQERNFAKAENCYAQVVALNSTGADYALFQRGYALGLMKRYNDKINVLEQLIQQYPRSDYADDGLYETARAFLIQDKYPEAVNAYDRLLRDYPNSNLARKAALEKAMTYYNMGDYNNAITAYKQVIERYPQSEESYSALEGLQAAYIENNNIAEYVAYTKTLGKTKMVVDNQEDSLVYITAERQYMLGNYNEAAAGFKNYTGSYCPGGRYCTNSQYYLADSYYRLNRRHEALREYIQITEMQGNPYMEEACQRAAEITYDNQDYKEALKYFRLLQKNASSSEKTNMARLGILRCSYFNGDNESTVQVATEILDDNMASADVMNEARYNRGKAFYNMQNEELALADLKISAEDVRSAQGAEAKYLCSQIYFDKQDQTSAEAEIMDFAKKNTSHQFWLAKSFILLSDIYVSKGEIFQAKQYLLSLQSNYKPQDEIQDIIAEKLKQIETLEQENNNDDEDEDDE